MIPYLIEKAVRYSVTGRPGAVYIDLPGDILNQPFEEEIPRVMRFKESSLPLAEMSQIIKAKQAILNVFHLFFNSRPKDLY